MHGAVRCVFVYVKPPHRNTRTGRVATDVCRKNGSLQSETGFTPRKQRCSYPYPTPCQVRATKEPFSPGNDKLRLSPTKKQEGAKNTRGGARQRSAPRNAYTQLLLRLAAATLVSSGSLFGRNALNNRFLCLSQGVTSVLKGLAKWCRRMHNRRSKRPTADHALVLFYKGESHTPQLQPDYGHNAFQYNEPLPPHPALNRN